MFLGISGTSLEFLRCAWKFLKYSRKFLEHCPLKWIKLPSEESLIKPVEKASFRKTQSMETFLRKRNITPARIPYKTCEKGMIPKTIVFCENREVADAILPYKTCRKSIVSKSQSFGHKREIPAARTPYKTCWKSMLSTTTSFPQKREIPAARIPYKTCRKA